MSSTPEGTIEARYRLLLVGESDGLGAVRERLERGFGAESVATVPTAADALDRVDEADCLVSDLDAISPLADETTLPIVGITEDDESTAIDAGATDVLSPAASDAVVRARIRTVVASTMSARIRERAERYRAIFDASAAAVLVLDAGGTVEWASPATDRSLEYPPDELEGDDLSSLVHPDDRETITEEIATVAGGQLDDRTRLSCRLRLGSGRIGRHGIDIRNRLSDPALSGLVCTLLPETDALALEPGASTAPADAAVSPEGLDRIDDPVLTVDDDWIVRSVNGAAAELRSPQAESPIGVEIWELLPPGTLPSWFEELSAARARNESRTFEVPTADDDGFYTATAYPADGALTLIARRRDETAASRMQAELDATGAVLDTVPSPAFLVENDRISVANAATFDYTGRASVVGQHLGTILDEPIASAVSERANASIRRVDPIEWTPTVAGVDRTVELSVVPLADDRAVVVGVDVTQRRRLTGSLTALTETVGSLMERETVDRTRQGLTEGVRSAFDVTVAVWYREYDGQLAPLHGAGLAEDSHPPPISMADARLSSLLSRGPTSLGPDERIPVGNGAAVVDPIAIPIRDGDVVIAGNTDRSDRGADDQRAASEGAPADVTGPRLPDREGDIGGFDENSPLPPDDSSLDPSTRDSPGPSSAGAGLDPADDIRLEAVGGLIGELAPLSLARAACLGDKRELSGALHGATQVRELIDDVIERRTAINRTLRTAETRSALERALCTDLVELEPVEFAVVAGQIDSEIDLRAHAGSVPQSLTDDTARASALVDPIVSAGQTRSQVVESIEGPARGRFADHGEIRSVIATPIAGTNRSYGVLAVYVGADSGADILPTLCADVATGGFLAIDSIETREALLADDTVELELSVPVTGDDVLPALADELGTTVDLDAVAPGDGHSTFYVTVRESAGHAVRDVLEPHPAVSEVRRRQSSDGSETYEVVVDDHPLVDAIASYGGVLTAVTDREGAVLLRVVLPADRDVRSLVDALREIVPDVELVARRPTSRHGAAAAGGHEILAELTDRQREILRTAYAAGYFEFPRDRTGEEIASQLGISQPTFTRHFRSAERTIFDALFGEGNRE